MDMAPEPLAEGNLPCPDGCEHPLSAHSADLGCWLCDCLYGRAVPGLTSALEPGLFTPVPLSQVWDGPGLPDGTTASKCRACGETRIHRPGDLTDPWKKHTDYCAGSAEDETISGEAGIQDTAHTVPGELDAAYARSTGDRFDGLTHPDGHDGVATAIDVWADLAIGTVDVTIGQTNIRLNLTPAAADALGRMLISEAARAGETGEPPF
jgi:hypothetical protein